ncbi:predicted glycosyltransferase [Chthonomonas calidirosea]|uniref:glycosyltransferase family 2 protein n=1 Tax=Chthonomonas calidirosea TaxID=454171 RepID=UPI0006DD3A8C|nr:glycosyltransferase family 2 protein [Chthonomonas calidirosea]CEK15192.1 predicted glycosyltransferase [Chthonomonas calidirosea]
MDLSIVIVNYNTCQLLRACLASLPAAAAGLEYEVWVVDNASQDHSADMVAAEFPAVHLIASKENLGFAKANNLALKRASGRYCLLLNPDTEPKPGALRRMVDYLDAHPDVGAIGPKLLNSDGSLQRNGRPFPSPLRELLGFDVIRKLFSRLLGLKFEFGRDDFDVQWNVDHVSGACIMVPRRVIEEVGMLDEAFFMFYEEVEWCWRIKRAGYRVVYLPQAEVVHHWMGSVKSQYRQMARLLLRSSFIYYRKTAPPPVRLLAAVVNVARLVRNEFIYMGVMGKRLLRRLIGKRSGL